MLSYHNYLTKKLNRILGELKHCRFYPDQLKAKSEFIVKLVYEIQENKKPECDRIYSDDLRNDYLYWRNKR